VVTLDVEMPDMDGIEFLKRLMPQYPLPVIVVSAVTGEGSRRAMEALNAGAIDVIGKPAAGNREGLLTMVGELCRKIKEAASADMGKHIGTLDKRLNRHNSLKKEKSRIPENHGRHVIAIGASTGGTAVLNAIVPQFPPDIPGVVIVQHMPPVFTRMFAESLDRVSAVEVKEACDGDMIIPGRVLIAPGDFHMTLRKHGTGWQVFCKGGDKVSGHRPSVDVLLHSVAQAAPGKATGLVLTGMGKDGAEGLLAMRRAGCRCYAQSRESSVVFGMPCEAWENGAAESLLGIEEMTDTLLRSST
jgi:two-component system chemotaxis response regulator CheB